VEQLLASGEHPRELTAYFGAGEYAALAALAREAQKVAVRAGAPARLHHPRHHGLAARPDASRAPAQ